MKRLLCLLTALFASAAMAATLSPIQMLNPAGSSAGQAIVSSGPSTAPSWGNVVATSLAPVAANTVIANATAATAAPTAHSAPSCSASGSALKWTSGSGLSCGTTFAVTSASLGQFAATTSAQLAGVLSDETGTGNAVFSASPTITTPNIVGTATNNNAAAGSVGEYASNTASGVNIPNGTNTNITSLTLGAGDWDVHGSFETTFTGTNTGAFGWLTTTTAGSGIGGQRFVDAGATGAGSNVYGGPVPEFRLSIASSTTIYLVGFGSFSGGTASAAGKIWARRVR